MTPNRLTPAPIRRTCGNPAAEGHRVPVSVPDGGDSRHGPPQRVAVSADVGAAGVLLKLEDGNAAGERQRGSQDTDIGDSPSLQARLRLSVRPGEDESEPHQTSGPSQAKRTEHGQRDEGQVEQCRG